MVGTHGGQSALAVACWLGTTIIAQSWRLSLTASTTAVRRLRAAGASVRMAPVSQAWLREYDRVREAPACALTVRAKVTSLRRLLRPVRCMWACGLADEKCRPPLVP